MTKNLDCDIIGKKGWKPKLHTFFVFHELELKLKWNRGKGLVKNLYSFRGGVGWKPTLTYEGEGVKILIFHLRSLSMAPIII